MKTFTKIKALIVTLTVGFVISLSSCMMSPNAGTVVVVRPRPVMMRPRAVVVVTPGYGPGRGMYRPYRHCGRRW